MSDAAKTALRRATWDALGEAGVARFPGARGRIPNFVGAEQAAERLCQLPEWQRASRLKCNPDSPQRPVRHAALKAGKVLYMPVPKLADQTPFIALDPDELLAHGSPGTLWYASSIKGATELGRPVAIGDMETIDLIVTGCVAVSRKGGRLGKGGGYSDLEYALLREVGLASEDTPIATTVHSLQVVPPRALPMTEHDISLDIIVTQTDVIRCRTRPKRPEGILWHHLSEDKLVEIPVLRNRRRRGNAS